VSKGSVEVTIAGSRIHVPIFGDEAVTKALAERVSQEVTAIEKSSERIDTQAFALQAAMAFAAESRRLEANHNKEVAQLQVALDQLSAKLAELLERHTLR
jgi:cell division protein ZapA (FtsZ GTPase activity inhibitor)